MKVLIIGGTGFIGKKLTELIIKDHNEVVLLTRNLKRNSGIFNNHPVQFVEWDGNAIPFSPAFKGVDAIINLAGESIAKGRWTKTRKEKILNSRIKTTKAIIHAIDNKILMPEVFISASAIGFYGPHGKEILTEESSPGDDFLATVTKSWEEAIYEIKKFGIRVASIRIGVVLGVGGALQKMILPYKLYVGGNMGTGRQYVSWIHIDDLVRIFLFILKNREMEGPFNGTAPNPITMKEFHKVLGKVINRPSWLTVPGIVLRLILGEMSTMLLEGQRVIPEKLIQNKFQFYFENVDGALTDILKRK